MYLHFLGITRNPAIIVLLCCTVSTKINIELNNRKVDLKVNIWQ